MRPAVTREEADPAVEVDVLTQRLEVVSEELAVADDELAAQQREIDDLITRELEARQALSAVTATVPVPVLVTDAAGGIREANQAAATLLGLAVGRLLRKPVQALIHPDDRGDVRELVSRSSLEGNAEGVLLVVPRNGAPRPVRVVVTSDPRRTGGRPSLTWVLAPDSSDVPAGLTDLDAPDDPALHAVAGLTTLPVGELSTHELLTRIAALATTAVRGATWTSVVLGDPVQPQELAADSEVAQGVDGAQWNAGEGPSTTAHQDDVPVVVADLSTDERWPRLAQAMAHSPVRSALAVPIRSHQDVVGVLTLYGEETGALGGDRQLDRALVFAEAAAAVLADLHRIEELRSTAENLTIAMKSRATIEQAKGLIAGWLGCSVEEAFDTLTRLSQDRNVKLRDLAALVVADPSRHDLEPLLEQTHARLRSR
ncbi:ANTAR domain-containing protein [Kineococcus sp. SYSU DK003]|uniref:ANTAR domain-containing protein n=1 Tax=Kineococcus sp. SYSU DK003 TaxID=3383124 RepID=UPI003D7DE4C1